MMSHNNKEEDKIIRNEITIKKEIRKRKSKLYADKTKIVNNLDQIMSDEKYSQGHSKRLKKNNYQPIIKTGVKAKLKIKLEPHFKAINKKFKTYTSCNKNHKHENENVLQHPNNIFEDQNSSKLVINQEDKVKARFIKTESGLGNNNDENLVDLKNNENKKFRNINVNKKSVLLTKENKKTKKVTQSKINHKSRRQIKQLAVKSLQNVYDKKECIIDKPDLICKICKQKLDNQLKFYSGEPKFGFEEELANIDSRLLLVNSGAENFLKDDNRVHNKLTNFSFYCKNGHLCSFDFESIEKNKDICFSGYLKPIHSDDPSVENGIPGKDFGPIVHWKITFSDEQQPIINFSTEIGDYILMEPSKEYTPFMKSIVMKIIICKVVIEYLMYEPNATYEDLLDKMNDTAALNNGDDDHDSLSFTEDTLMRHAPLICDQVMLFDESAKPWEQLLVLAPCIRRLLDFIGITLLESIQTRPVSYWKHTDEAYCEELMRKAFKGGRNHSATQELIDKLLPNDWSGVRTGRCWSKCGICKLCKRPSIGCRKKNYNLGLQRSSLYQQIQGANAKDAKDNVDGLQVEVENSISVYKNNIKRFSCFLSKLSWLGKPLAQESGKTYFNSIKLDDEVVGIKDFVFVCSEDSSVPAQIVKIAYMWEDEAGVARFHANYLWSPRDTILGNLADPKELFFINRCCNMAMSCVIKKAQVLKRNSPKYLDKPGIGKFNKAVPKNSFYYQKCYDPITGCFRDLQCNEETFEAEAVLPNRSCHDCEVVRLKNERNTPRAFEKLKENDGKVSYAAIMYRDEHYRLGSCVYLKPKSLYYKYPMLNSNAKLYTHVIKDINMEKYPEYSRKFRGSEINSKPDVPAPFDIGFILDIFTINDKLFIRVKKLYRPENTCKGEIINQYDANELFWSNEECTIPFNHAIGKCYVMHAKRIKKNLYEWLNMGPDRFYFIRMYENNQFYNIDTKIYSCKDTTLEIPRDYPNIKKLRALDIFAGCGGLSLGLSQSGAANICWAVESNAFAAKTYKLNHPNTTVFVDDANNILKLISKGEICLGNQDLPRREHVELLCAALPSKNFKYLNNISSFKNSSIATFISYCEYYKPSLFVLEADEGLVKNNIVLKLTLTCFVNMGYQVRFSLLQVGCYGAPQNRKVSVVLGAVPGETLPTFPRHLHVFPKLYCQSDIVIDNKKYTGENYWAGTAPYKVVTVRDALWDLPNIKYGESKRIANYYNKPGCYFQKMMRFKVHEPIIFDHVCKDLGSVVKARIMHIPTARGSDWQNIPNIDIHLEDRSFMKKLVYDKKWKKSKGSGDLPMSSCICPIGKSCYLIRNGEESSLIPWYLVHSGSENSHWPGLYSRLQWDGFFTGAITSPEPLSKQGPVIHPTQPRVVSVRECARSQGFPDNYVFPEEANIREKYRQIGCAISPLLSLAIGREIAWSLDSKKK